jgi:hypothetical protein
VRTGGARQLEFLLKQVATESPTIPPGVYCVSVVMGQLDGGFRDYILFVFAP